MSESSDKQATAQHYLVCGNEDCQENGHQPLCEHCKDEHVKSPKPVFMKLFFTDTANINFLWRNAIFIQHETLTFFVKNAKLRYARYSTLEEHQGHKFDDIEEIYAEKYALQQDEFPKIQKYFLPTSFDLKTNIEEDATQIRKIIEIIRTSIKTESEKSG